MKQIEFDFSIYHPLDHSIFDVGYCHSYYGGTRRHLQLSWEFGRTTTRIRNWINYQTNCRWGRHHMQPFWRGAYRVSGKNPREFPPDGYMCANCIKRTLVDSGD